jgi:hypothetical protein
MFDVLHEITEYPVVAYSVLIDTQSTSYPERVNNVMT